MMNYVIMIKTITNENLICVSTQNDNTFKYPKVINLNSKVISFSNWVESKFLESMEVRIEKNQILTEFQISSQIKELYLNLLLSEFSDLMSKEEKQEIQEILELLEAKQLNKIH